MLHFGEMGSRWGINRTVGQMYALLYLSERPLNAEEIAETLAISRSNVSMGIKELMSWRLIRLQHLPGDRKDYFSTPDDVLEIARILVEEKRKRELDPTLTMLRDTLLNKEVNKDSDHSTQRMQEMYNLLEQTSHWSEQFVSMDRDDIETLMKWGGSAQKLLDIKSALTKKKKV